MSEVGWEKQMLSRFLSITILILISACAVNQSDEQTATLSTPYLTNGQVSEPTTTLTLIVLDKWSEAVCNDGSPAAYYFRRGSGAGARSWIIHLQGGGICTSITDCDARRDSEKHQAAFRMTSNGLPQRIQGKGIVSTSPEINPDFYNFNHVIVHYCSSDAYAGDRAASAETGGYHFRGNKIVTAVIASLQDRDLIPSPNLQDATDMLFSGVSAGGAGVVLNLDRVAEQVPDIPVRGLSDGAWQSPLLEDYGQEAGSFATFLKALYEFYNLQPDDSCASTGDRLQCKIGPETVPYLSTPLFVVRDQLDGFPSLSSSEAAFVSQAMRDSLAPIPNAFSTRLNVHTLIDDDELFSTVAIKDTLLREVIANWYFEREGITKLIDEPLNGKSNTATQPCPHPRPLSQ